ncbi:DNA topoisomerase I [Candidatus Woesearchaeota archaeon]|nr:MAG: DNA topoisomerase I [Candidatus Woesearchaeota archaeon]
MAELIVTEKPSTAGKIADALADGKPQQTKEGNVSYYTLKHDGKDIIVACAVGHLYTIAEKDKKGWTYPVFDVKWDETYKVNKEAKFSKKYLSVIKKLAKKADKFTIATDYDIEGEVIGLNIIKYACKQNDANRMKFSTVTKPDLIKAYENKAKHLDWGLANAGVTRHELDWYYGINLSRALTLAIKNSGAGFKILSSGRVQGPALKIIVDKEKAIKTFKPEPYWEIELKGEAKDREITAMHEKGKFDNVEDTDEVIANVKDCKTGVVVSVEKKKVKQVSPHPFDLTSLQTEAYRTLGVAPKKSLQIAQELYTSGYISYPRTSSQQYPKEIGYKNILKALSKQSIYQELCNELLKKKTLIPNNGKKTDPAHPAIYPTGITPKLTGKEMQIYDLIVRRFMATFADVAIKESMTVRIDVNKEIFIAKGMTTVELGWFEFYGRYAPKKEEELPAVVKGDEVRVERISRLDKETQPPKRYTPASIIREMEKLNIGTKATRSDIIENLFNRGYITGKSIEATELGIRTVEILEKYSPSILDVQLTRHFEEEMEKIRQGKLTPERVLEEAKTKLKDILSDFKKKEKAIGKELWKATVETRDELSLLGKCPNCAEGELHLRRGKFGNFIACNKYPECNITYNLPNVGLMKPAKKICEHCGFPMIQVIRKGKKPQEVCFNPKCPGKKVEDKEVAKEVRELETGKVEKVCPKCGKPLVVRTSIYGKFLGCSGFPKCRHTEKLTNGPLKEDFKKKKGSK